MFRSERKELFLTLLFTIGVIALIAGLIIWLYARSNAILTAEIKERLKTQATLAAMQFSAEEIVVIDERTHRENEAFQSLVQRAEDIRSAIPDIEYLYIFRPTEESDQLAFVIENDMLTPTEEQDANGNGIIEEDEEIPVPGDLFDASEVPAMLQAFEEPTTDAEITVDQWGQWMSGYSPIRDTQGNAVAIVGLDMRADQFIASSQRIFSPLLLLLIVLGIVLIMGEFLLFLHGHRMRLLSRVDAQRRAMVEVAAHKLGGPIATLRWWVELTVEGTALKKTQLKEAHKELSLAVERLSDVTKHLDDATRTDGSNPDLWQKLARETARDIKKKKR